MKIYISFYFCFTHAQGLSERLCSFEIKFSMRMFVKYAHKLVVCCELMDIKGHFFVSIWVKIKLEDIYSILR